MRWLVSFVCLLVGSLALSAAAEKKTMASTADEQAVVKIEHEWAAALLKADVDAIDQIVAEEWAVTTPDGKLIPKKEANEDLKNGTLKFAEFKLDELTVKVYGQTALAFGVNSEKSTYKGKDTSGQYRFTDVFIKRDGRWVCVATHVTKVAKSEG